MGGLDLGTWNPPSRYSNAIGEKLKVRFISSIIGPETLLATSFVGPGHLLYSRFYSSFRNQIQRHPVKMETLWIPEGKFRYPVAHQSLRLLILRNTKQVGMRIGLERDPVIAPWFLLSDGHGFRKQIIRSLKLELI